MSILETVNYYWPDTICKFALRQEDLPSGQAFMGGFVELFEGKILPSESDVTAKLNDYQTIVLQSSLISALAEHRYSVQNGGTTIANNQYKTDPESRLALTAVFIIANSNPAFTISWKMANNEFIELTSSGIITAAMGVLAFVQKCFDTEKNITTNIASYSTIEQIIEAFNQGMAT